MSKCKSLVDVWTWENVSQGILECMLLSLFSVENNVIENVSFAENTFQIFEKQEGLYLRPKIMKKNSSLP